MSMFQEFSGLRPDSTFLALKKYRNQHGEVADYQIIFHASYENALKRSISILDSVTPDNDLESQAKAELIAAFTASLNKTEEKVSEVYAQVYDTTGKPIKGVKVHKENGTAYIFGNLHNKIVYQPGVYKPINKAALTIAKDNLRKLCPVHKFRQFIVKPGSCEAIKVESLTLLP